MDRSRLTLDAASLRKLAVEASVEPRSLLKALHGEPVRGLAGYRAREVLERHGLILPSEHPFAVKMKPTPSEAA